MPVIIEGYSMALGRFEVKIVRNTYFFEILIQSKNKKLLIFLIIKFITI